MFQRLARRGMVLLTIVVVAGRPLPAADAPARKPVVIAAVKGVDRLLESVDQIFGASGNGRFAEVLRGFVANLNNLKGVDRNRPFGLMAFAPARIGDEPEAVFFIPVESVEDLKTSIRLGNVISLEDGPTPDRLGFKTPEKTIPIRLAHNFAFLSENESTLEADLPDPAASVNDLLQTYDGVVSIRKDGVPETILGFGKSTLEALAAHGVQQEPGESDADFHLKKEIASLGFEAVRSLYSDADQLNIGWKLEPEAHSLSIEANLVLEANGTSVSAIRDLASTPARFASLAAEPLPLAIVYHLSLPPRVREILDGILDRLEDRAEQDIKSDAAALKPPVMSTLDSVRKTLKAGQIDGFVQVVGGPPDHYYAVGGLSIVSAEQVAAALRTVLPFAGDHPKEPTVEMGALTIGQTEFHRIREIEQRPQDRVLYGDDASLLVGVGQEAVWFGLGGDRASEHLSAALGSPERPNDRVESALLRVRFHLTDWLGLIGEDSDQDARNFRLIAQRAFPEPEDDEIEFTIAPTTSGLQARIRFEQGYLRLVGHAIAASQQGN